MKLAIETADRSVSIECPSDDVGAQDVVDLFRAAMLAIGFLPSTVNEFLG